MESASHPAAGEEIAGYRVIRELSAGKSWLAEDSSARKVVLKVMPEDCLHGGQLRASIRDRLARIREAAHGSLANLLAIQRDGDRALLVWEYIEGQTLEEAMQSRRRQEDQNALARELIRSVEALHSLGLVHGALHAHNVIISDRDSTLWLTDASPLLYTDPQDDVTAVAQLLGVKADAAAAGEQSLRRIAESLSVKSIADEQGPPSKQHSAHRRFRREAVALALLAIIAGVGITALIYWYVTKHAAAAAPL